MTRESLRDRISRKLSHLASTNEELAAEELRETSEQSGCASIGRCADREKVRVTGTVRTVTLQPRDGNPALEAELYDGTGTLMLVFLGRRRIAGIEPGRKLQAVGRIALVGPQRVMFNPSYELQPGDGVVTPAAKAG
jgi:hypothetical protein